MTAVGEASPRADELSRSTSRRAAVVVVGVGAVLAAGIALRFITKSELWFDEALSVNIARVPFSELGDALRQDGAPPLYYVLLHLWMDVFGTGDVAVRALSGVISVATLPLAFLAGRRVGGRVAAWGAVLVLASSPYAIRFATETRMYALVMFLVLWGYLALRRALETPSWARLAVVGVVTGLLVYTQYWSFYLVAVVGLGLAVAAWRASPVGRAAAFRTLLAVGVGTLTLLPWLDTLWFQLGHTGTPWGEAVVPWFGFAVAMSSFAGGYVHAEAWPLLLALLVLPLVALFGAALDARRIELDLRTRPAIRWEFAVFAAALWLGLLAAWVGGTAFDGRYAAIVFPLLVVVVACSLAVFTSTAVRVGLLVWIVALGFAGGARNVVDLRTQSGEVAHVIAAEAARGDVVVYCPDQLGPDTSRLLADVPGLRQETYPDGASPLRINWVDYRARIARRDPTAYARSVLESTDPTATIWLVHSSAFRHFGSRCDQIGATFAAKRPPTTRVVPDFDHIVEHMGLTQYAAP